MSASASGDMKNPFEAAFGFFAIIDNEARYSRISLKKSARDRGADVGELGVGEAIMQEL